MKGSVNDPAKTRLKLGTRGSPLSRWQANLVKQLLLARHQGLDVSLEIVRTRADSFPEKAIAAIGTGVFTRELDEALIRGEIDLAVHSMKDIPSELPEEISFGAVLERESPLDAFVSPSMTPLDDLEPGARLGTGSPRRKSQLLARRPDLVIVPLRGNVDTRLRKIKELELAGTVLAHAGLRRLGREEVITHLLPVQVVVPAVGQGAVAVCVRFDDEVVRGLLACLDHPVTRQRVDAERSFLSELRGGCLAPVGALASVDGDRLRLEAIIADLDGSSSVRGQLEGEVVRRLEIGGELARKLLEEGGSELLARSREESR